MRDLTQGDALRLFQYDPEAGHLIWRVRSPDEFRKGNSCNSWNTRNAGKIAGCLGSVGYLKVTINGHTHLVHRIIWLMVHGAFPDSMIDHINGDPTDNRLCNLRSVSPQQNQRNRKLSKSNRSGVSGAQWNDRIKRWTVRIGASASPTYVGSFKTIGEALAARKAAEREHGYHRNHGRTA